MAELKQFIKKLQKINEGYCREVPSLVQTQLFIDELIFLLFPFVADRNLNIEQIEGRYIFLKGELIKLLRPLESKLNERAEDISEHFFSFIPEIYKDLIDDASLYVKHDPAAYCMEEIILCYPGFYAIMIYRLSHELYRMNVPILPRVISEYAHSKTGIDIHPGAEIGKHFYIDHGTGVVIGETTEIGENVKLYQGVTLGALYVEKDLAKKKRHPTLQDNVIVYAGSTILGGDTVIGHDTTIGGNVWLTESVQPYSVVYRKPRIIIKDSQDYSEPINFSI